MAKPTHNLQVHDNNYYYNYQWTKINHRPAYENEYKIHCYNNVVETSVKVITLSESINAINQII